MLESSNFRAFSRLLLFCFCCCWQLSWEQRRKRSARKKEKERQSYCRLPPHRFLNGSAANYFSSFFPLFRTSTFFLFFLFLSTPQHQHLLIRSCTLQIPPLSAFALFLSSSFSSSFLHRLIAYYLFDWCPSFFCLFVSLPFSTLKDLFTQGKHYFFLFWL